ncbi:MAG: DNA recombination/repair protein RecA, partial [Coprobacillus cateniformis]
VIDLAVDNDIIDKSGAWYAYQGEKIGQGRENVKIFLAEHPEIMTEIENKVKDVLFPHEETK